MLQPKLAHLLIKFGCPIDKNDYWSNQNKNKKATGWECHIDYYSCDKFITSVDNAIRAHTDFSESGIDYEKSGNFRDNEETGFDGSCCDGHLNTFLSADIVAGNGEVYRFCAHISHNSIAEFVCAICDEDITLHNALESLMLKISKYAKKRGFEQEYFKCEDFTIKL